MYKKIQLKFPKIKDYLREIFFSTAKTDNSGCIMDIDSLNDLCEKALVDQGFCFV